MRSRATRDIACFVISGLLLAACGTAAAGGNAPSNQRHLEANACKLISSTPVSSTSSSSFEAISLQSSTLLALEKTDDASLKATVRAYDNAAKAHDNDAMIRALNDAVNVCHRLGLKTAT
jgi:hypothetical protein